MNSIVLLLAAAMLINSPAYSQESRCVYLKNAKFGEYLYSTADQPVDSSSHRVFTWRGKSDGPASDWGKTWGSRHEYQGVWFIEKKDSCLECYTIKSAYYGDNAQPLYAVSLADPTFRDPSRRPVYTYRGRNSLAANKNGDSWKLETVPGYSDRVRIKYTNAEMKFDEYFYAVTDDLAFDQNRRNVYTWSSKQEANLDSWGGVADWIMENAVCPTSSPRIPTITPAPPTTTTAPIATASPSKATSRITTRPLRNRGGLWGTGLFGGGSWGVGPWGAGPWFPGPWGPI